MRLRLNGTKFVERVPDAIMMCGTELRLAVVVPYHVLTTSTQLSAYGAMQCPILSYP